MPPNTTDACLNPIVRPDEPLLGKGHRVKQTSIRLHDFVTNTTRRISPSSCSSPSTTSSGVAYPISYYVNCNNFSLAHHVFLASILQKKEPFTYVEAIKDNRWREAMKNEIQALENNITWMVTHLPLGKKALGCKWVYKIKHKFDVSIKRFKAQLVILGNH